MRTLPHALLQVGDEGPDQGRNALCRTADVIASPRSRPVPHAGRLAEARQAIPLAVDFVAATHWLTSVSGPWVASVSGSKASISLRQAGQYQGAGVFTGLGLRLRHLAQGSVCLSRRSWVVPSFRSWECSSTSVIGFSPSSGFMRNLPSGRVPRHRTRLYPLLCSDRRRPTRINIRPMVMKSSVKRVNLQFRSSSTFAWNHSRRQFWLLKATLPRTQLALVGVAGQFDHDAVERLLLHRGQVRQ